MGRTERLPEVFYEPDIRYEAKDWAALKDIVGSLIPAQKTPEPEFWDESGQISEDWKAWQLKNVSPVVGGKQLRSGLSSLGRLIGKTELMDLASTRK